MRMKMNKFISSNSDIQRITFQGNKYFFIVDDSGIGIRRQDDTIPKEKEVKALTEYIFEEGWANKSDYEEEDNYA
jgi:hypothetical protein